MLFDFGFNLTPSVDDIKKRNLHKRLENCERRIKKVASGKFFSRELLLFIRTELDLRQSLIEQINHLTKP
jgi:hypothetical protein